MDFRLNLLLSPTPWIIIGKLNHGFWGCFTRRTSLLPSSLEASPRRAESSRPSEGSPKTLVVAPTLGRPWNFWRRVSLSSKDAGLAGTEGGVGNDSTSIGKVSTVSMFSGPGTCFGLWISWIMGTSGIPASKFGIVYRNVGFQSSKQ